MDLSALGEENLARDSEENDKNWIILLCRVREREREKLKKLLKKYFERVKPWILKNLIHDIRLIEKQFQSIETDRDSLKFLIAISIYWKTDSIDRNCKKMNFWKSTEFDTTSPQSIEKLWKEKSMSMRWNDFHKPKI